MRRLDHAAQALVGTPFRLHGRDPARGLDCLGLIGAALARCGSPITLPTGYALRGAHQAMLPLAQAAGLGAIDGQYRAGDVLLVQAGPAQAHLLILTGDGFIHAHAGLRRVVHTPGALPWTVLAGWRLPTSFNQG